MATTSYPIEIAEFNSAEIRHMAAELGATHMRLLGSGHSDGDTNNPNSRVSFYAVPDEDGAEWFVADTNGDPVWEDQDAEVFAQLAAECGVTLD
jgi:hypothetical protein